MENDKKYKLYKFTQIYLVYDFLKQNILLERKKKKKNQTYKLKWQKKKE